MATGGRIDYTVGFKVDTTQLNTLKTQLGQLQTNVNQLYANNAGKSLIDPTKFNAEVNQINASIAQMQTAFNSAFNTQLGTLNISKFNQALESSKIPLSQIQADFYKLGSAGQNAFRSIAAQALSTNMQLKQSHTFLTSMADTLVNTMKWGVASSAINTVANSVRKAYDYTKQLDKSLNNISIVTEKSADDMRRFAKEANKAAKELGSTTTKYTDAALIYYQQGDSDAVAQAKAEVTLKTANVTKQSTDEVSEQLTAVWNGYKVSAQEAEMYVDKLAAVAASTASDLEELSTGMSKVASAAATMGVDIDQLNGMLATMISVTRESPETIGTSMKTILARISDIEAGLDGETSLTSYTEEMSNLGFNVLDANGKLRDMGDVIEEIGSNWNSLSREQQISLAHTMAGQRQYSRLLSLFDNWGMYEESLKTSQNSLGTLNEQNEIYMESMEAHLNKLTAASEKLYGELMDPEGINPLIDSLTTIVDLLGSFTSVIGGGAGALQLLGLIGMKVFQKQIVSGLTTTITNMQTAKHNATLLKSEMQALENLEKSNNGQDKRLTNIINMKKDILKYSEAISNEDRETLNQMIQQTEELYKQQDALREKASHGSDFLSRRTGESYRFFNKDGGANQADIDKAKEDLNAADLGIKQQESQYKGLTQAINELTRARALNENEKTKSTKTDLDVSNAKKNLNSIVKSTIISLKEEIDLNHFDVQSREQIETAIKECEAALKKENLTKEEQRQLETTILKLQEAMANGIRKERAEYNQLEKEIRTVDAELENNRQALENGRNAFENFKKSIQIKNIVNGFVNGLNAVSQFAMGLNSLANAWDAIRDPDMSGWEKFTQITMGLSMGFGMLVSGLTGFSTVLKTFKGTLAMSTAAQVADNIAKKEGLKIDIDETKDTTADVILLKTETELLKKKTLELQKQKLLEYQNMDGTQRRQFRHNNGIKLKKGEKVTLEHMKITDDEMSGLKKGVKADIKGAKADASPFKGIKEGFADKFKGVKQLFSKGGGGGALLGGIALIAAGIVTIKVAFEAANKIINKNKIAMEKAAQANAQAAEEVNKAKSKYEEFKSTISGYNDAVDGMANLTKGTVEYKEKLMEANEAALQLINSMGLMSGTDYTINADGLIEITTDAQNKIAEAKMAEVQLAQSRKAYTQQKENDAKLKYDQEQFARKTMDDSGWSDDNTAGTVATLGAGAGGVAIGAGSVIAGGVLSGVGAGAAMGSAAGPIGLIAGALIGLVAGGIYAAVNDAEGDATKEEYRALEDLAEETKRRGDNSLFEKGELRDYLEKQGYDEDLIKSLEENNTQTEKQIQAIIANTEQLKLNYRAMVNGANQDNEYYNDLSDQDKALADSYIAADRAEGDIKETKAYKDAIDKMKKDFEWSDKQAYETYFEELYGPDWEKHYKVENSAGTHFTVKYRENETDDWTMIGDKNSWSNEDIMDEYATRQAMGMTKKDKKAVEQIRETGNIVNSVEGVSNEVTEIINQSLANKDEITDLTNLSLEQIQELQKKINEAEGLNEKHKETLQAGIDDYLNNGGEEKYMQKLAQRVDAKLETTAKSLEMDKDTLETYTEFVIENNQALEDNKELAIDVAAANISYAKGTENLQKALEDNLDILKEWDTEAPETAEAVTAVKKALEEMFGVEVDADFVHEHLEKIRKAAEGDIDAIEELSLLAAKDYTENLIFDETKLNSVNAMLDELANKDVSIGIDTKIDTAQGVDALNELLRSGAITEEQMNKMFSSIGYKPNVVMVGSGKFTAQKIKHKIEGPLGIPYEYTDTVESEIMVPQIVPEGQEAADIKTIEKGGLGGDFTRVATSESRAGSLGSLGDKDIKSGTEKNKKDLLDEERDIYHDINIELQKLENNLEKVQKAREKMVGGDIIDSLDKELDLLDKQIAAQKTKLEIAKLESQTLKETLSGQGVQFAEDGTITNYNAILDAKEAEINGLINAHNNASSTDAQEKIQEQIDKKQEEYDKFKENLERYDEVTFSELAELENEVSEAISQKIELNIEKFTKDINLKVDLNEFKKEWRELQQNILFGEDDNFASFQSAVDGLQDVFGEDGGLLTDQLERTQLFLQEYDKIVNGGTSAIFEDSAAAALEAAQEMHEMSMESAQQALEYINTLKDAVDAAFEQIMGLHDSILDTFDHTLAVIEHQIAVKELLFGNNANIEDETEAKLDVQLQKIEAAKNKMEDARKRAEDILNGRTMEELEADEEDFYKWTEQQVDISEAYETVFSSVEEALQTINTLLQQDIQNNLDIVEDKLTNNVGWDRLSERWEKDQEIADVYLSGVNKEYELQKLLNKINQDLLDKQYDSINAQKKINDFKNDELAILMQKDKLTQAELDRANKLYELTLLQIALDEARNNKSSMKLTRDSQGNYVYQYTVDEDAVTKAEQDLADKRNELYNQNVDNTTKAISDFNSLGQEMQDEIAGIFEDDRFQEYLGLSTLENRTEEEQKRFEELDKWLYGTIDEITSDYNYRMGAARDNAIASLGYIFKDLGIENVDLNNLTDEQRQILLDEGINMQRLGTLLGFDENTLSKTLTDLDANIQSMIDTYIGRVDLVTDAAAGVESPEEYYETLDLIKLNTENLRDRFKSQQEKVWKEYSDMDNTLKSDISLIEENLKSLVKEGGLLATNNKNITDKLQSNADSVAKKIDEAILAIGKVETAITGLMTDINSLKQQIKDNQTNDTENPDKGTENPDKEPGGSSGGGSSYSPKFGDRVQYGSNTGSKSWKVQSVHQYDGRVDLINQLTGKSKTVHMSELTGKYNGETWVDISKYKGIKFAYDTNQDGIINAKDGGTGTPTYTVIAKTSSGKFILKSSTGQTLWADTNAKINRYIGNNKKLSIFDTGGYTGQWFNGSKDGRLAMLHQKELILNEKDTPKILDAVKLVREISAGSIIKDFEAQMRNTLSSLENQLIGTYANIEGMAAAAKQSTDQMLEQAVHIDASFPGVRDAREIEEALNNLVNVASQYAYENNK